MVKLWDEIKVKPCWKRSAIKLRVPKLSAPKCLGAETHRYQYVDANLSRRQNVPAPKPRLQTISALKRIGTRTLTSKLLGTKTFRHQNFGAKASLRQNNGAKMFALKRSSPKKQEPWRHQKWAKKQPRQPPNQASPQSKPTFKKQVFAQGSM